MRIEDFDYELPPERIAQHPAPERDAARMLLLDRRSGAVADSHFRQLPQWLRAGDLAVFNDTRVIPARLYGRRAGLRAFPLPGARNPAHKEFLTRRVEVLLSRRLDERTWEALVRPGRKLPVGERIYFGGAGGDERLEAEIIARGAFGERRLRFDWQGDFFALLDKLGRLPLPPYIHRPAAAPEEAEDRERYQTVYARQPGAAAAPTAGLHFTPEILRQLDARGIERTAVTLEVGLGTFQPVRAETIEEHAMHTERYQISAAAAEAVNRARREDRRVVAIGTTVARALEARSAAGGGAIAAGEGETDLFLYPGRPLCVVDALLTNFHAPRSTLLMLVAAFAGREAILAAYRHAVAAQYRFLSYGDCMFIA
ncbi:MAG: tRNA preQ1(34) S-adenosylmethionine ribosyltransferase-isomerase QueA [Terriglobales bacterium]